MTDRNLIFSGPMVRALLEGRKTQTRRLLRILGDNVFSEFGVSDTAGYDWCFRDEDLRWHELWNDELLKRLRHQTGDRIWVREAFSGFYFLRYLPPRDWPLGPIWYWADGNPADNNWTRPKPSIHMPRWASRLTLIVTDVRVQRLHDISEEDARAEGIFTPEIGYVNLGKKAPVIQYAMLWNSLHGPDAWDSNPWVSAITFTVHHGNIDQMRAA